MNTDDRSCALLRKTDVFETVQSLPYRIGVSRDTVGATQLSMHVVTIPPRGRALAHRHAHHESALYVISGSAEMWYGDNLATCMKVTAGDLPAAPVGHVHGRATPPRSASFRDPTRWNTRASRR